MSKPQLIQGLVFLLVIIHVLFSLPSDFTMSKRDSVAAHLPSLASMAEEMQLDTRHGPSGATASTTPPAYGVEIPMLPGPSSSSGHGSQPLVDPRDLPVIMGNQIPLQPAERRVQTVHTIKFQRVRYGNAPTELKIEETDVSGFSKIKTLEHYFFGIFNHCSSFWYSWSNSVWMANYWRRFFNVDEAPEDQQAHDDYDNPGMPDVTSAAPDHEAPPASGQGSYTATHGHLPIPRHVVQLAWMLDSVLQQVDPVMHPEVAQLHQQISTGTLRDLSSLNVQQLADLGVLLSITAHQLARQADPPTPAHEIALPPMPDDGL